MRAALAACARELRLHCGGRAVRASNLHLTLAFVGDVLVSRIPGLTTLAGALPFEPCTIELDACGYWRHNRIVWAAGAQAPVALVDLADRLAKSLRAHGFRHEERPYAPHVTLLRDARRAPRTSSVPPIRWPVTAFFLMQSVRRDGGVAYESIARWSAR